VDVLIDRGDALVPVEIKSGQTVAPDFFAGLEEWRRIAAGEAGPDAWLVYGGDREQTRQGARVVPWRAIGELADATV
jgi:hypothetical protein